MSNSTTQRSSGSPSVSIVLATHNRRDWLRLAMDSVLAQDYPDLELLVMDDGSSDETPQLLEEYARRHPPERFRFFRHDNMGQARTLNRGYELARGEVLGYLSDDDLLAPEMVSRLVRELADPDVVAVYPGYYVIDDAGEIHDTIRPIEYSPLEAFRLIETVIGPGCLARRPVLESIGGWDPSLHFMGDFILWIKVGLAGRVVRVPEALASWRRHSAGITLQGGAEHGKELLSLVDLGAAVLGLPPDETAIKAEALRNAALQAAFLGAASGGSRDDRFATIDLTRPGTSAFTGGIGSDEMPDERADQAAELWRELALLIIRGTRARSGGETRAPGTGLEAALGRLRRVGALADEGGSAPGWDRGDLRPELMEAALECGADTDPGTSRYLVLDRLTDEIPDEEFEELNWLGFRASPDRLRALIDDRRLELSRMGVRRSTSDR
jgi:hypothetical protein